MNAKVIDAVQLKRKLQKLAEQKLAGMNPDEQIKFLQKKFGKPRTRKAWPARNPDKMSH